MIQHDIHTRSAKSASVNAKDKTPKNPESTRLDQSAYRAKVKKLSVDQIYAELSDVFGGLSDYYIRAAECVMELESRGERVRGIPDLPMLRKIASGQIAPELMPVFVNSSAREVVCDLPISDQKKIAANPIVPVYEPTPDGKFDTRMVDLTKVCTPILRQVVSREGIRTPEEQKAHLAITQKVTPAMKVEKVIAQTAAKYIDEDVPSEALDHSVTFKVTESEYRMIAVAAAERGISKGQMVRRLMLQSGALNAIKPKRQPISC